MKNQLGYTFIEITIVISMMLILFAFSLPMISTYLTNMQNKLLQNELMQTLQFAYEYSRIKNLAIGVCKSNNQLNCGGEWGDGQLIFNDLYQDGIIHSKKQIIRITHHQTHRGQIFWRAYPIYRDYLLFNSLGMLENSNATFWYCPSATSLPNWALIISKSGRIRSVQPDKKGEIEDGHGKKLLCHEPRFTR